MTLRTTDAKSSAAGRGRARTRSCPSIPTRAAVSRAATTVALALSVWVGPAHADLPPGPPPQPSPQVKPHPTTNASSAKATASAKPDAGAVPDVTPEDVHAKAARIARAKNQREAELARVKKALGGKPMDDGLREELKIHARRVARLERARAVAREAKDEASAERAAKLLDKEAALHEAFLAGFEAKAKAGAK